MHNQPSVTIDAGVLAIPHVDCAKSDALQYVETLLNWKEIFKPFAIYMSEQTYSSLSEDGLYPDRKQLRQLLKNHSIGEYDAETIAKFIDQLLKITPSFEERYHVEDVSLEHLETDPDIIQLTTHENLRSNLTRCITLLAVLRKHCSQLLDDHLLILRKAPEQQLIQVKARIRDLKHSRDDLPAFKQCPSELFEGDVLVYDNFRGLIDRLDETSILIEASDDSEIKLAIRIALFKDAIVQGNPPNWSGKTVPVIGSKFRELCRQVCKDQDNSVPRKILRSIVEIIEKRKTRDVHALRTGRGGNNLQKMRGDDKAWRRDIDREFHLHYWECEGGTVELASVVYHDDFSIPE